MQHTFSFEKLNAWQEAKLFTKSIYVLTKQFPDEEKFGLVSQMRRASISICSNIAEGTSRTSSKDQAYFYQMAYGSLLEVLNQAIISNELTYLSPEDLSEIRLETEKISNLINALRKSTLNRKT
jgi:four helix bundle protein